METKSILLMYKLVVLKQLLHRSKEPEQESVDQGTRMCRRGQMLTRFLSGMLRTMKGVVVFKEN